MSEWIYPKDLADGKIEGFPKISLSTQIEARRKRQITYSKAGRNVVYKKEWVEAWLEKNIRKAQSKAC